eukprot:RCo037767
MSSSFDGDPLLLMYVPVRVSFSGRLAAASLGEVSKPLVDGGRCGKPPSTSASSCAAAASFFSSLSVTCCGSSVFFVLCTPQLLRTVLLAQQWLFAWKKK